MGSTIAFTDIWAASVIKAGTTGMKGALASVAKYAGPALTTTLVYYGTYNII